MRWIAVLALGLLAGSCADEAVVLPPQDPAVFVVGKADAGPPAPATSPAAPEVNTTGLAIAARDPRRPPRERRQIAAELAPLEQSARGQPAGSTSAALLLRQVAECYVELRKVGDTDASAKAMRAYDEVLTLSNAQNGVDLDETLYYDALEHEVAGESSSARKRYFLLIQQYPASRWVPLAYFAFGEMFLKEAKTDASKWDLAKQAYAQVLKYPQSGIVPEALLRAGQIEGAQGDAIKAHELYERLRRTYPQSRAALHIGDKP